jgi:AcrR family transcriptional regulator
MPEPAPKPRARLRGQTLLHERQRATTRERILAAAREVFAEKSYAATTTNDLVERAGVGRTSFYRHFDGKWAIAKAMQGELMEIYFSIWKRIAVDPDPAEAEIAQIMEEGFETLQGHKSLVLLFTEISAIEQDTHAVGTVARDRFIETLGETIPAFRYAASSEPEHLEAWVWGRMITAEYWQLSSVIASYNGWTRGRSIVLKLLARRFCEFVAAWRDGPPAPDRPRTIG